MAAWEVKVEINGEEEDVHIQDIEEIPVLQPGLEVLAEVRLKDGAWGRISEYYFGVILEHESGLIQYSPFRKLVRSL